MRPRRQVVMVTVMNIIQSICDRIDSHMGETRKSLSSLLAGQKNGEDSFKLSLVV